MARAELEINISGNLQSLPDVLDKVLARLSGIEKQIMRAASAKPYAGMEQSLIRIEKLLNRHISKTKEAEKANRSLYGQITRLNAQANAHRRITAATDKDQIAMARAKIRWSNELAKLDARRDQLSKNALKQQKILIDSRYKAELAYLRQVSSYQDRINRQIKRRNRDDLAYTGRLSGAANARGQFGAGVLGLVGGATRIGGVLPGSAPAFIARQGITGGLLGFGAGNIGGALVRGVGGGLAQKAQGALQGLGTNAGRIAGRVVGTVGGIASQVGGYGVTGLLAAKGASYGAAFGIVGEGGKALLEGARMFTSAVTRFASTVISLAAKIGGTALAAGAAFAAKGVGELSARQQAYSALGVVAGNRTGMVQQYLENTRSRFFSRTERSQAVAQGLIFGLEPERISSLLPGIQNAAILTGKPVGEGLRAVSRAAFQAEPEAAEAFGLNLYERNIKQLFPGLSDAALKDPTTKAEATFAAARAQLAKFAGAEQAIAGTIPGAERIAKTGLGEFFLSGGKAFAEKFGLAGRLSSFGDWLQGPKGTGIAAGIGNALGGAANYAADFAKNKLIPGAKQFFSTEDEGTTASKFGDMAFNALGSIANMIQAIPSLLVKAKELFDKLKAWWDEFKNSKFFQDMQRSVESGLIAPLRRVWSDIESDINDSNWEGLKNKLKDAIYQGFEAIRKPIEETLKSAMLNGLKEIPSALFGGLGKLLGTPFGIGNSLGEIGKNFRGTATGAIAGTYALPGYGTLAGTVGGLANDIYRIGTTGWEKMHSGGVVPGPYGKEVPAMLQAGEMVISKEQAKNLPKFHRGTTAITGPAGSNFLAGMWNFGSTMIGGDPLSVQAQSDIAANVFGSRLGLPSPRQRGVPPLLQVSSSNNYMLRNAGGLGMSGGFGSPTNSYQTQQNAAGLAYIRAAFSNSTYYGVGGGGNVANYEAQANAARAKGYQGRYGRHVLPTAMNQLRSKMQMAGMGGGRGAGLTGVVASVRDSIAGALTPETYTPTSRQNQPKSDFQLAMEAAQSALPPGLMEAISSVQGMMGGGKKGAGGPNVNINGNISVNGNNNWRLVTADGV